MTALHRFLKDDTGEAAIEFLLIFPIIFTIFTASFESSMQPVNTANFVMAAPPKSCVDKSQPINTDEPPANEFTTGTDNDIMLMRVCLKADPMFPTTAVSVKMPVEADGSYVMLVTTTFVNEPG